MMLMLFFVSTRPIFKKMDIPARDQENVTSEQTSDSRLWFSCESGIVQLHKTWFLVEIQQQGDTCKLLNGKLKDCNGPNIFFSGLQTKFSPLTGEWNTWFPLIGWAVFWSISAGT